MNLRTIFRTFLSTGWRCFKDSVGTNRNTFDMTLGTKTQQDGLPRPEPAGSVWLQLPCFHPSAEAAVFMCKRCSVYLRIYLSNLVLSIYINTASSLSGYFIICKQSITRCFSGSQFNVCAYINCPKFDKRNHHKSSNNKNDLRQ